MSQKKPRGLITLGALLVLVASAVGTGSSLMVWKWKQGPLEEEKNQALLEREQARKAETETKQQRDLALTAARAASTERDEAVAVEHDAQGSAADTKEVLAFLQNNVFSAAHSQGWGSDGPNKNVTLRQAVDAAAAKVDGAYPDKPLIEASIREILGSTYADMGEATKAVKELTRALALRERLLGPDQTETVDCRNKLAVAYRLEGHPERASSLYEQDPESPSHAAALAVQGAMLLSHKRPGEAEAKLRECLAIREKTQPDEWTTYDTKALLGAALLEQKNYAEAEQLLLSGYQGLKQLQAKIPSREKVCLTRTLENLVHLYKSWDKKDQLTKWRKEMSSAEGPKRL